MTDLITNLFYFPSKTEIRDYKGYHQHRNVLFELRITTKLSFRLKTGWMFLVTDLYYEEGYTNNTCSVERFDGRFELTSIDDKNRITIGGRKYSNWICYF